MHRKAVTTNLEDTATGEVQEGTREAEGRAQNLRWDAPDVEAGPAEGAPLLDAGGLEPELRGLDRRDVPAGPAAQHDD